MPTRALRATPLVIGHRGDPLFFPENTMPGFQSCVAMGAHGVEFDVQRTADGHAVVIHDAQLGRTTNGKGAVGAQPLRRLRQIDAGAWFDGKFRGTRLPLADEVIAGTPRGFLLMIEFKGRRGEPPAQAEALIARVLKSLRAHKRERDAWILSFDPACLDTAKRLAPDIPTALNIADARAFRAGARRASGRPDAFSFPLKLVTRRRIATCRRLGCRVFAWGIATPAAVRHALDLGIDALVTDNPREVLRISKTNRR